MEFLSPRLSWIRIWRATSKQGFENGQAKRAKSQRSGEKKKSFKKMLEKRFYFKCALKWFSKSFKMGDNGGTQLILVKDELDRCMDNGKRATWC